MIAIFLITLSAFLSTNNCQTVLQADGHTDTYKLISSVFGGNAVEPPDCLHKNFGPHITQTRDSDLQRYVFVFHLHKNPDGNRCERKDRQRNEVKTYNPSPDSLKGFKGNTMSFSWNFKLDSGFQPSKAFTHIHQLKGVGGNNIGTPIITITPRQGKKQNNLQVIHVDAKGKKTEVKNVDLSKFLGSWIHVKEVVKFESKGKYSLTLSKLSDNKKLLSYSNNSIEMWRDGASFIRPKWGIYRSLNDIGSLRDEEVRFDSFCISKEKTKCN